MHREGRKSETPRPESAGRDRARNGRLSGAKPLPPTGGDIPAQGKCPALLARAFAAAPIRENRNCGRPELILG